MKSNPVYQNFWVGVAPVTQCPGSTADPGPEALFWGTFGSFGRTLDLME